MNHGKHKNYLQTILQWYHINAFSENKKKLLQRKNSLLTKTVESAYSRLANKRPAWIATGVSCGLPSTMSPIA